MKSKLNPALEITDAEWVVSVIKRKNRDHALIVVESKNYLPKEGFCIRWFDMMPDPRYEVDYSKNKYKAKLQSFFISVNNDVRSSKIRVCPTYGYPIEHPEQLSFGWRYGMPIIHAEQVKREDFLKVFLVSKKDSWLVDSSKVNLMIASMMQDKKTPPSFQINGGPIGDNCMTWIWKKLDIAGIHAQHNSFHNFFGVQPAHNVGRATFSP